VAEDLRRIESVDRMAARIAAEYPAISRQRVVAIVQRVQAAARRGDLPIEKIETDVREALERLLQPSLRRVINATGVILHTNLGRAPLVDFQTLSGYSNLEYDLASGKRGKRDSHFAGLLEELLGVAAIAVNNNAAATYLVLRALAESGEVIVSRGELVEIGDGFRIPEIMEQSGARLKEVGATNRTRLDDYRRAVGPQTKMLMRVHPSNFHVTGFTGKPELGELAALAKEFGLPLYEDLGSGCLVDLTPFGVVEPLVTESLLAGVDIVSFSCDKLLGGPQAGIIAGRRDLLERVRRHPMYRAFRLDKLQVQALASALASLARGRAEEVPALRMVMTPLSELAARAESIAAGVPGAQVKEGRSVLGGGSTPDQSIATWLVAVHGDANRLERRLRTGVPPVIARIEKEELLIDPRTLLPDEDELVRQALITALS
jgi:L-seryl-tRNA(Ser) seleniumtransferase